MSTCHYTFWYAYFIATLFFHNSGAKPCQTQPPPPPTTTTIDSRLSVPDVVPECRQISQNKQINWQLIEINVFCTCSLGCSECSISRSSLLVFRTRGWRHQWAMLNKWPIFLLDSAQVLCSLSIYCLLHHRSEKMTFTLSEEECRVRPLVSMLDAATTRDTMRRQIAERLHELVKKVLSLHMMRTISNWMIRTRQHVANWWRVMALKRWLIRCMTMTIASWHWAVLCCWRHWCIMAMPRKSYSIMARLSSSNWSVASSRMIKEWCCLILNYCCCCP